MERQHRLSDPDRLSALEGIMKPQAPDTRRMTTSRAPAIRLALGADGIDRLLEGGLVRNALHEVRCAHAREIAAATGFVTGLLARLVDKDPTARDTKTGAGRIVWVTDPATAPDAGTLYPSGLAQVGLDPLRLILIAPTDLAGALWAADEAVKCRGVSATVLQIAGNPRRLDLTATRRLMLRARESGGFACLLRQSGEAEASAAMTRWRIAPRPGAPVDGNPATTTPGWNVTLEKNREGRTGEWALAWNSECKAFDHVPDTCPAADSGSRLHAPGKRPRGTAQMGQVVAFGAAS